MSDPSSSAPEKGGPPKKSVSPARNAIGLVLLIAVVVFGYFEVSAKMGYRAAADALNNRLKDEEHGLPSQEETEQLIGKQSDDAGSEVKEGVMDLTKKSYTWKGIVNSYTLVAFYTKSTPPALYQYEAGEKVKHETLTPDPAPAGEPKGGMMKGGMGKGGMMKGGMGKGGMGKGGMMKGGMGKGAPKADAGEEPKPAADAKTVPEPDEKAKPAPDEKAKPAPDEKAKPAPDEKAKPAPDEKAKPAPDEKAKPAPDEKKVPDTKPDAKPAPSGAEKPKSN